jgi:precorrin-6B methylase 2
VRRAAERRWERRYGVETATAVYLEDLGIDPENRVWHQPSDWLALRRALERLRVTPDDVFVDYGSGLGRAMLVAASFPFRRVIGVELSPELTASARLNIQRNRCRPRAGSLELVTTDALAWDVPPDVSVAYLYCPFIGDAFDRAIRKLLDSVDEHPRPLRIVYNYPVEHSRLIRTGRVRVLDVVSAVWLGRSRKSPDVIVTYLVLPSDQALRREYITRFPQRVARAEHWLGEYEPGYVLEKPARLGGVVIDSRGR